MESKLAAAPLALAVLATLALISAQASDFSLLPRDKEEQAAITFSCLKIPSSYRACLAQVGNEMFDALRTAHSNMSFIHLSMKQIPGLMEDVVILLFEGTQQEIEDQMKEELSTLQKVSMRCQEKVQEELNKFDVVLASLGELTCASQRVRGDTEKGQKSAQASLNVLQTEKENAEKEWKEMEKEVERNKAKLEQEEKEFKQAIDQGGSMPDLGKQLFSNLADTAANTVIPVFVMSKGAAYAASAMTNKETFAYLGAAAAVKTIPSLLASPPTDVPPEISYAERDVIASVKRVADNVIPLLQHFFKDGQLDLVKLKDTMKLDEAQKHLTKEEEKVGKVPEEDAIRGYVRVVLNLYTELKQLCKDLQDAGTGAGETSDALWTQLKNAEKQCLIHGEGRAAVGETSSVGGGGPGRVERAMKGAGDRISGKSQMAETYVKTMMEKLNAKRDFYNATEKKANEMKKKKLEQNKELQSVLKNIAQFQEDQATQKEILDIINEGLKALHSLRKQWSQIFLFFKQIDNILQATMGPTLNNFIEISRSTANRSIEGATAISRLTRGRLHRRASSVLVTSQIVSFLSTSYLSLSTKHLQPLINRFGDFMALDKSTGKEVHEAERQTLLQEAQKAQDMIASVIEAGHAKFKSDLAVRYRELDKALTVKQEEQEKVEEIAHQV